LTNQEEFFFSKNNFQIFQAKKKDCLKFSTIFPLEKIKTVFFVSSFQRNTVIYLDLRTHQAHKIDLELTTKPSKNSFGFFSH